MLKRMLCCDKPLCYWLAALKLGANFHTAQIKYFQNIGLIPMAGIVSAYFPLYQIIAFLLYAAVKHRW